MWTLKPMSAAVWASPWATRLRKRSSEATSHLTSKALSGMPPMPSSASGFTARRVHRTTPSGSGSPEATPRVNGSLLTAAFVRVSAQAADGTATAAPAAEEASRIRRDRGIWTSLRGACAGL